MESILRTYHDSFGDYRSEMQSRIEPAPATTHWSRRRRSHSAGFRSFSLRR